jgi:hypothetical protein
MKPWHAGLFALSLCCACVRFGYDAKRVPTDPKPDAASPDASKPDAATTRDSGTLTMDAAMPTRDASTDAHTVEPGMPGDASTMDSAVEPDAGTPGAASIDSGTPDAATNPEVVDLCPERADAIFCDGYEDAIDSDAFNAKWQFKVDTGGTFLRATSPVHSGTGALKAMTTHDPNANSYARYGARVFPHLKAGNIWARAWYYIPSTFNITGDLSTLLISEIEPPYFGFSLVAQKTRMQIGSVGNHYPQKTDSTFPRDRWVCVELHVQISPTNGVFEAYVDGALTVYVANLNTLPAMGYRTVEAGIHYTNPAQGDSVLYVDDVVAGYVRLGCN